MNYPYRVAIEAIYQYIKTDIHELEDTDIPIIARGDYISDSPIDAMIGQNRNRWHYELATTTNELHYILLYNPDNIYTKGNKYIFSREHSIVFISVDGTIYDRFSPPNKYIYLLMGRPSFLPEPFLTKNGDIYGIELFSDTLLSNINEHQVTLKKYTYINNSAFLSEDQLCIDIDRIWPEDIYLTDDIKHKISDALKSKYIIRKSGKYIGGVRFEYTHDAIKSYINEYSLTMILDKGITLLVNQGDKYLIGITSDVMMVINADRLPSDMKSYLNMVSLPNLYWNNILYTNNGINNVFDTYHPKIYKIYVLGIYVSPVWKLGYRPYTIYSVPLSLTHSNQCIIGDIPPHISIFRKISIYLCDITILH